MATLKVEGPTIMNDVSANNLYLTGNLVNNNILNNYRIESSENINIYNGAVFLICIADGGDNECVGKLYYQRSSEWDGSGLVDIVVSSRGSSGSIPHGFCSYQTDHTISNQNIPHRFSLITGIFSDVSYVGLKYEGGNNYIFSELFFNGLWKSNGTNKPFDIILDSSFISQTPLPIGYSELSLKNKSLVIDSSGNVGINQINPNYTLDIDGTLNVTGNTTVGGTLGVTGNTTVGGTLGVTGNTTVGGTLGVTGNTTVGGTLGVTGNTTVGNTLFIGNNDNSSTPKTIKFGGTIGDNDYEHSVIETRVYGSTEKSELLLFKGNDTNTSSGVDRIRLRAAEINFDTYSSATSDRTAESIRMRIKTDGKVVIGKDLQYWRNNFTDTFNGKLSVTGQVMFRDEGDSATSGASGRGGPLVFGNGSTGSFHHMDCFNWSLFYINYYSGMPVYVPSLQQNSDDRIKKDETDISNATTILLKLNPQKYKKYKDFSCSGDYIIETGLIAQEVYYEVPELRHIVFIDNIDSSGNKILPTELTADEHKNIKNDLSYNELNWGEKICSVGYNNLFSYLIKGFQEQQEIIDKEKEKTANLQNQYDTLMTQYNNILERIISLESRN